MKHLSPRDLINVGVFSAIYFVLLFALGMIGFLGPAAMPVGHSLAIFANGVTIALYQSRVPKFGAMALLGLIVGTMMLVSGHVWYTVPIALLLGIIADLLSGLGSYRTPWIQACAYAVFTCWYITPMLPLFFSSEAFIADIAQQMGDAYAQGFKDLFTPSFLLIWSGITVVLGFVAGLFGQSVLRRHFSRAGLAT